MLPNYGEGKDYAVRRLRKEIDKVLRQPKRPEIQPSRPIKTLFSCDEDFVKRHTLLDEMSLSCIESQVDWHGKPYLSLFPWGAKPHPPFGVVGLPLLATRLL